jgi:hypothetical protein
MQITPLARAVNHVLAADTPMRVDLAPLSPQVEWPSRKSRFLALVGEGGEQPHPRRQPSAAGIHRRRRHSGG